MGGLFSEFYGIVFKSNPPPPSLTVALYPHSIRLQGLPDKGLIINSSWRFKDL